MAETTTGTSVTVRYWAGAAAAAGTESDVVSAATVGDALDAAVALHPELAPVVAVSTCLLDGVRVERDRPLASGDAQETLEILPPFAGG
ncbi:MAG: MoaD/ThiS family protein [Dermatophilus congolensis]|nr:MoaD/ThiS family protein [Dermatophilus congolensis]